ncbi:MAG: S9 family peptidase [Candidatus Krumholzibacteria bacterium]|nr:S9 family peptidase [Candidatus Krumholzibacteria bacterium]MDH5626686.1 S9 family peptidase [Candidatus Krumholzibacteria bacterium]
MMTDSNKRGKDMTRSIQLGLAICLTLATSAHALTVAELMSVKNITEARISPDGATVAFGVAAVDSSGRAWDADVWTVDVAGGAARRITHDDAWDDTPRWAPDGSGRLAFVSDREGANQVFMVALPDPEPRQLTDTPNGVTAFAWSPDASRLAFLTPGGQSEAARRRAENGADVHIEDEATPPSRIHIVDVATGTDRELPPIDAADVTTLDWSPDGTRLAVTVQDQKGTIGFFYGSDIAVVDVTSGAMKTRVAREGMDFNPRWSPDGKSLAFLSHGGVKDWIGSCFVCVVAVDGDAPPRNVSPGFDERDYGAEYLWSPDSKNIYLVAPQGVTRQIFAIDAESGQSSRLSAGTAVFGGVSVSADGSRMAFQRTTMEEPAEIFVSVPQPFAPVQLTHLNDAIATTKLGRGEIVRWKSFDGLEIEGILVTPAGRRKQRPLVTVIHGGPSTPCMAAFSPQIGAPGWPQADLVAHTFVERDYAVFFPNFRGSSGYGRDFMRANMGDWGGGDFKDVMTGIDMLVERGVANPKQLAIVGWSYGGTLTSFAITQTPRFAAAVVGAGVTDHLSQYGTTDIPPLIETYMGGTPWKVADTYRRCSSVTHAADVITPTLLCYGENDARVPPSQGREFYRILKRREVPAELVVYPRSGHFVFEPALEADFQARMLAWVDRWIEREN